jgi:hypothetical protein
LLWLAMGSAGVVVGAGAGLWLWRWAQTPASELPGLAAAVIGVLVGVAQVIVAALHLSRSKGGGEQTAVDVDLSRAGMISLAPPAGLLEGPVRGRDELIAELSRVVVSRRRHEPTVQVLHGMGGSGKTTIALAMAREAAARGVTVWWVSAATLNALETGLRQLARRLGVTDQELRREWTESGPDLLWRRLSAFSGRWLLIIDNADDIRLLSHEEEAVAGQRGWVRPVRSRRGGIIVTSRDGDRHSWGPWAALHHIGMLSGQDSAQVLVDRAGAAGSLAEATRLGARLGGLPLALGLAGAYLADTNRMPLPGAIRTFTGYRQALDTGQLGAVFESGGQALSEQAARGIIGRTWELSLDLLRQRDLGLARPLLRLLASFADAPIPYEILLDPVTLAGSGPLSGLDTTMLRRCLHGLDELSLIDIATDPGPSLAMLRLHPLIRDACRYHLTATEAATASQYQLLAVALLAGARPGRPDDPLAWPGWAALSPHVLTVFHSVIDGQSSGPARRDIASVTRELARYLAESGQYVAARDAYAMLLPVVAEVHGDTQATTLTVRANLALWTGHAGDAVEARRQFALLVTTLDEACGPEHPATLAVRANLADWTGHAGDAAEACAQFSPLQAQYEQVFGPDHPDTLAVRANLAWWTGVAGHARSARDQFAALLPLREQVLGPQHPATLTARANLALWTGAAGQAEAALALYTALLPLFTPVFGGEHPATLSVRANLARWTGNTGDPHRALEMYRELRPTVERVLGARHPAALVLRANIALWTGGCGHSQEACRLFAELLPERLAVSGADHPSTLVVRANAAFWAIEAGQRVPAAEQAELMQALRRVLGDTHPTTITLQAQFDGATVDRRHRYNALIPIVERITGAEHPRTMALDASPVT